jgi:FtsP/CotA-like multicopper oxidase with cupredoxin domain
VPNAADGVAGVTQDAVERGQQHIYRFVAAEAGTYWYHSHQVSHKQVAGGLLGAVVIAAPEGVGTIALVHLYGGTHTVNGLEGDLHVAAAPGTDARIRIINTDNGLLSAWVSGAPFRLVAVDGTSLNAPPPVSGTAVALPAGGRADLAIAMPADGSPVRVQLGGSVSVVLGTSSSAAPTVPRPSTTLDLLSYGTPSAPAFDPAHPNRTFRYDIGRRPGFINGRPGLFWTINGHLFPGVPMFMVSEGDVVRMTITNHSGEAHPMHLHGHHALVLSRNGIPATGSPWSMDSLEVGNGESFEIAFVANNPGIWMDHCHNLPHAAQGLTAHLMYEGVTTPFEVRGNAHNRPE